MKEQFWMRVEQCALINVLVSNTMITKMVIVNALLDLFGMMIKLIV